MGIAVGFDCARREAGGVGLLGDSFCQIFVCFFVVVHSDAIKSIASASPASPAAGTPVPRRLRQADSALLRPRVGRSPAPNPPMPCCPASQPRLHQAAPAALHTKPPFRFSAASRPAPASALLHVGPTIIYTQKSWGIFQKKCRRLIIHVLWFGLEPSILNAGVPPQDDD